MPGTSLPTYQEATRTVDWLELAGPSISIRDYARLCRVSRHFCDYFLPRLWTDPFAICYALEPTTRLDGETPRTELFLRTVPDTRLSTRSLVFAFTPRIRDWLFMLGRYPETYSPSSWFANLRCMTLIDCPPPNDHEHIIQFSASQFPTRPYVVAAVRCSRLPVQWPASKRFREVVYFDDSRTHQSGPTRPRFQGMHRLRILRATGHNMGDSGAAQIFHDLGRRLWSLDLSNNRLTNRFLQNVVQSDKLRGRSQLGNRHEDGSCICFGRGHHHELEGSLCSSGMGLFIHETPWTEDLRLYHSRRYHEDSPGYVFRANPEDANAESREVRKRALDDSLDAVVKAICSEKDVSSIHSLDICQLPLLGITHLYLNQNPMITAEGFKLIIESGFEQLQRFECDSMLFITNGDMSRYNEYYHESRAVPSSVSGCKNQAISGILGLSHLFRPVFSNLQILRIHHSLVTNLPSLVGFDDLSAMEKIWFAETFLLPRADLVFPNPFYPDMNPRLRSLTLTHIPRYSTGPLIERLKGLLKAAWFQEQTIAKLRAEYRRVQSRYQPPLLPGLRKIILEFDPDPREKQGQGQTGTDGLEGFDAEALLNSGATEEFGTFGGFTRSSNSYGTSGPSTSSAVRHVNANNNGVTMFRRQQPQNSSELARLAAETPWVRAVLQSRHQQWPQEVERRAHEKLDWNQPIYVTSISRAPGKTKVFVGYHQDGHSRPVSINSTNNGVSSGLASSPVQDPYHPSQSPYHSQEQAREPRTSPSLPVSTHSLPPEPPAYTALPTPGPSTPLPLPASTTSTTSPSSLPPPPPPPSPPETPQLLTPIPPCYTSFPYFLSPEEKQASLTTYNLLLSRVLWLHPNSVHKKFSDPGYRPDPPAGPAGPAGFTASINAFSRFNASDVFGAYDGSSVGGPSAFEQRCKEELLRVLFHPIMAATPSMVRAGVPTQLLPKQQQQQLGQVGQGHGHGVRSEYLDHVLYNRLHDYDGERLARIRQAPAAGGGQQAAAEEDERLEESMDEQLLEETRRAERFQAQAAAESQDAGGQQPQERGGRGPVTNRHGGGQLDGRGGGSKDSGGRGMSSERKAAAAAAAGDDGDGDGEYSSSEGNIGTRDTSSTSISTSTSTSTSTTERRSAAAASKRDLLRKEMRRPTKEELKQMKDVIEELKKFRGLTGGGGCGSGGGSGHESKAKGKGKGKQKAVNGDGDGDGDGNGDDEGEEGEEDDDDDDDSKWAGKHWMGELKVIRKLPDGGGGF
ncbi:hypothetical protein B0H65DRAFT_548415 [Neurospora tetraspora]|uniref:Leucine rich repeat domain containing protein n=1 Tax=Neurospora tetraspora TaxID=94610 RepID=A0AAE0JEL3_9PEZI|nr:hypothetical protein B0H65DRAFT_548415 [Neurospora tetraspora]